MIDFDEKTFKESFSYCIHVVVVEKHDRNVKALRLFKDKAMLKTKENEKPYFFSTKTIENDYIVGDWLMITEECEGLSLQLIDNFFERTDIKEVKRLKRELRKGFWLDVLT